ncbi:MAG: alanyl-tRNA editing protein [Clostridiales bacterium]|nr:alanyl-tRNA editing protein [Clostridiales bacterium]
MRTERLFYRNSLLREFQGEVLECIPFKDGFKIMLDCTAFYPEGGGQPCDTGMLNQVPVLDVQEQNGEIWHFTGEAMEPGTLVDGVIDWERRFDLMQQHSGEHIVSGMIHERYGYNNIGFHMGPEMITIDFDGEIPEEELREIEAAANRYVWENHPVEVTFPGKEELEMLPYRSKKELTGEVRIVTWPGADICACCGVHVQHSGQIGQIMLVSSQRAKGGVRIDMLCGKRALVYANHLKEQNRRISNLLSAKWKETAQAVEKLQEECQQTKFRLVGMEYQKIAEIAAAKAGQGDQLLFEEQMSPESGRKLAAEVMETCGGRCAVFCGNDAEGYRYAIGEKDGDLRQFVKEMNQILQGRGGGKPFFVQGSLQASREEIEKFFEKS